MIKNKDITVVIQGPIVASSDRKMEDGITTKAILSIRNLLPGSRIILSTWIGQPVDHLDVDQVILNDDPGGNIIEYSSSGVAKCVNENRQIVTSKNGLKQVKTKYAIKLRSDNFIVNDNFKSLFEKYKTRCVKQRLFEDRVVINSIFTREISRGFPALFHPSDFFYFGKTTDLLKLWDIPLFEDYVISDGDAKRLPYTGYPYYRLSCEQRLFLSALKYNFNIDYNLAHLNDRSPSLKATSELTFANNFIIASANEIGLGQATKFNTHRRQSRKSNLITFLDYSRWQQLYKKHCDKDFHIKNYVFTTLFLSAQRLILVFPKSIQTEFKIFRGKIKMLFRIY